MCLCDKTLGQDFGNHFNQNQSVSSLILISKNSSSSMATDCRLCFLRFICIMTQEHNANVGNLFSFVNEWTFSCFCATPFEWLSRLMVNSITQMLMGKPLHNSMLKWLLKIVGLDAWGMKYRVCPARLTVNCLNPRPFSDLRELSVFA